VKFLVFAGVIGGLVAGAAATIAQLALWALAGDDVWRLLVADTLRAARLLLGPAVEHASSVRILTAAALVHVAVSIGYGVPFAALAARFPSTLRLSMAAAYGALVYAVNLHGLTLLWPWFQDSRGAATFGAHLVFGIALMMTLRGLRVATRQTSADA
jgi:uncharacterized membrane protein YagU involved in acid resistance